MGEVDGAAGEGVAAEDVACFGDDGAELIREGLAGLGGKGLDFFKVILEAGGGLACREGGCGGAAGAWVAFGLAGRPGGGGVFAGGAGGAHEDLAAFGGGEAGDEEEDAACVEGEALGDMVGGAGREGACGTYLGREAEDGVEQGEQGVGGGARLGLVAPGV